MGLIGLTRKRQSTAEQSTSNEVTSTGRNLNRSISSEDYKGKCTPIHWWYIWDRDGGTCTSKSPCPPTARHATYMWSSFGSRTRGRRL